MSNLFTPVATENKHLNELKELFNSTGEGVVFWNKLEEKTRMALCQFAGLDEQLAYTNIQNFHHTELRRLRAGTKELEKVAVRFNHISVLDFK